MKAAGLTFLALGGGLAAAGFVAVGGTNHLAGGLGNEPLPVSYGGAKAKAGGDPGHIHSMAVPKAKAGHELASFSGGCFWGVEDEFRQVPGVVATAVGFTGGTVKNPSYEQVCTHTTGHAETALIEFDPKVVSYRQLVDKFWTIHDPTTVDRQGPDEGNSYRSAIWTYSPEQAMVAKESLDADQPKEHGKIVTTIMPAQPFYLAEDYHQQYDEKTGNHFCPTNRP